MRARVGAPGRRTPSPRVHPDGRHLRRTRHRRPRHGRGRHARAAPGLARHPADLRPDRRDRGAPAAVPGFITVGLLATDEALYAVGAILTIVGAMVVSRARVETFTRGKSIGKYAVGPAPCATTPGRSPSTTRSSGPSWAWSRSSCCTACRPWSRPWSTPAASGSATWWPAPTWCATRSDWCCPPGPDAAAAGPLGASADIAPLPEGLAISIRQLLGRGPDLSPDAWRSLVVRPGRPHHGVRRPAASLGHLAPGLPGRRRRRAPRARPRPALPRGRAPAPAGRPWPAGPSRQA